MLGACQRFTLGKNVFALASRKGLPIGLLLASLKAKMQPCGMVSRRLSRLPFGSRLLSSFCLQMDNVWDSNVVLNPSPCTVPDHPTSDFVVS